MDMTKGERIDKETWEEALRESLGIDVLLIA